VSIIVAVHNEESQIAAKLDDCLRFLSPPDQMEIIIVSDGSTDSTEDIVNEYAQRDARVQLLRAERVGKSRAQNLAVQHARGEILIFTDAGTRTRPDLLQKLMSNFADPKVGLVTGVVYFGHPGEAVLKGQGFYWRYEFFLRQAESDIGILSTATGTALAMRRELFRPMEPYYGDDCILPLDVRLQRYRVLQDAEASVYDTMPHTMEGELRSRIRMTARNWTGTLSRPALLNPFRFPLTALGLISHKLLRWLTPFILAALFLSSTLLALTGRFLVLWALQVIFYGSSWIGWNWSRNGRRAGIFAYPFAFCLANVGFFLGMVKVVRNQKYVAY
jgi:cellulose synthase/poly-beta-1,6-N-acetylglucosamine synthase-like glycosyltransferase